VGLEVGLSAALLVTAGLLIASFVRLTTIDKGFDVDRVLAVDVRLPEAKYPNPEPRSAFFQRVLDQARGIAGRAGRVDLLLLAIARGKAGSTS